MPSRELRKESTRITVLCKMKDASHENMEYGGSTPFSTA
jgi:hypothetical protein